MVQYVKLIISVAGLQNGERKVRAAQGRIVVNDNRA